jgi:hypothetical protein
MLKTALLLAVGWFPLVAVALLVAIFLWRRLWRELPFFFLYLAYLLLSVAAQYVSIRLGKRPYFYTYWITDLVSSIVAFLPMYEVFLRRLFTGFRRTRLYRSLFPAVAIAILVLTVLTALNAHDKGAAFQTASRAFDFMRTAVLAFFIGLMLLMGRDWTRYDLGITLGFAIQASVALANSAARAGLHRTPPILGTIDIIAYNLSCLIWLITFWKPERRTQLLSPEQLDPEMLHQARSWETQLKAWLTPGKSKR